MIRGQLPTARGIFPARRIVRSTLILVVLGVTCIHPAIAADEIPRNVALYVIPRENLFFSLQGGTWTSVRVDAGKRILQRGADGNVAIVLTSQRAIVSAPSSTPRTRSA